MLRYRLVFFYFIVLASCTDTNVQDNPTMQVFSKQEISKHWTLQLPIGSRIGLKDSVYLRKKATFPDDSLSMLYYSWVENLDRKTDCSFSARVKRMESERCDGICQGDGSIDIKYVPIINRTTQITGCRGDWESNHRRFVVYLVYDCETGEFLTLDFERVGPSNFQLVENIITSLEFKK